MHMPHTDDGSGELYLEELEEGGGVHGSVDKTSAVRRHEGRVGREVMEGMIYKDEYEEVTWSSTGPLESRVTHLTKSVPSALAVGKT